MTSAKQRKRMKMEVPTTTEEKETFTDDNVGAVFLNSLVLDNLVKFLSFSDIKSVSAVNSDFLRAVRGTKRWNQKVILMVTKDTKEFQHYLRHFEEQPWRGMKIDVLLSPQTVNLLLPRILDSVQFLAFMKITKQRRSYEIRRKDDPKIPRLLLSVLSATPKLVHLQIDLRLWLRELRNVLSSPAVQANLKNLKHLDILELDYNNPGTFRRHHGTSYYVSPSPGCWSDDEDDDDDSSKVKYEKPFEENFRRLSVIPMRLESFKLAKIDSSGGPRKGFLKHLLVLLRNSRETIKELSVHLFAWKLAELRVLKIPGLKRLTVTVEVQYHKKYEQIETLAAFLKNHPTLEELDVEVKGEIGEPLFSAIQGHCTQLKKLHIKTPTFSGRKNVDWAFLGLMEHLVDFAIVRPDPNVQGFVKYGTGVKFLASLPKNQLESLRLKGISKMDLNEPTQDRSSMGFWTNSGVRNGGLELKIQLLHGFTCLRRLSLINCLDSLDDQLMQFIVKEFKLLEELEVSHCSRLSDAGIAGTGDATIDSSIANLRSLKTLIIRSCPLVTTVGLMSCLTLPCLKLLEFMTLDPVGESFALNMAVQNPSLESLFVNYSGKWMQLKKQLKGKNTRLKRVGDPIKDYADMNHEPGERIPRGCQF